MGALATGKLWSAVLLSREGRSTQALATWLIGRWARVGQRSVELYAVRTPMDEAWVAEFEHRMRSFGSAHPDGGIAVSLKVRVTSGCFHREHSPSAYVLIDEHLASMPREEVSFDFLEHESGPEVLVYLAFGTAGLALAKSLVDLLVAIIAARREGVKEGDPPSDPIELIVRRVERGDSIVEEMVLRIGNHDPIDRKQVEAQLDAAIERLASESTENGE